MAILCAENRVLVLCMYSEILLYRNWSSYVARKERLLTD